MKKFVRDFGVEIRKYRKELGASQETIAEKAGIHRTYLSAIENGKADLSLSIADKVTKALGKKLSQVIAEVEKD